MRAFRHEIFAAPAVKARLFLESHQTEAASRLRLFKHRYNFRLIADGMNRLFYKYLIIYNGAECHMPRVSFFICSLVSLSACTLAEVQPFAIADQIGQSIPGKGIVACAGLPLGGQKCEVELPQSSLAKAAATQAPSPSSSQDDASHASNAVHG